MNVINFVDKFNLDLCCSCQKRTKEKLSGTDERRNKMFSAVDAFHMTRGQKRLRALLSSHRKTVVYHCKSCCSNFLRAVGRFQAAAVSADTSNTCSPAEDDEEELSSNTLPSKRHKKRSFKDFCIVCNNSTVKKKRNCSS